MAVLKAESSKLKVQGVRLVKVNKRKATLNGEPVNLYRKVTLNGEL